MIKVWDLDKAEVKATLISNGLPPNPDLRTSELWSLSLSSDGKTIAAAGQDRIVRIWDVPK